MKGWLEQAYGELTGDPAIFSQGNEDRLVGYLQQELNKPEEEVRQILAEGRAVAWGHASPKPQGTQ